MPPPSQPQGNSLLHLLNPYASVSRSTYPNTASTNDAEPDSPSTMLLRELQGDEGEDDDHGNGDEDGHAARGGAAPEGSESERLTPTHMHSRRQSPPRRHGQMAAPGTTTSSEDEEDEGNGPPRSIMYGEANGGGFGEQDVRQGESSSRGRLSGGLGGVNAGLGVAPGSGSGSGFGSGSGSGSRTGIIGGGGGAGDRTPKSPAQSRYLPAVSHPRLQSPGPFRIHGPSSSSASERESQDRSRSTSPGPSTISNYASGLEGTNLDTEVDMEVDRHHDVVSRSTTGESSSGRREHLSPPSGPSRAAPTFKEVPLPAPIIRPGPPRGSTASGSKAKPPARLGSGSGYLDPTIPSPRPKDKGKGKARNHSGRVYHGIAGDDRNVHGGGDEDDEGEESSSKRGRMPGYGKEGGKAGLNEYERALWKWVNVDDLDGFLQEVYAYYKGKGLYCIALARVLNLLTTFFVIGFSTFLSSCIDYSKLWKTSNSPETVARLDDVLISQCLTRGSFPHMLFIVTVALVYIFQLFSFALSLPRLWEMHQFYTHLLGIPDIDIQTLPWPEIVRLIGEIRKHNPITSLSNGQAGALADMVGNDANSGKDKKLDAHDVANRILRQENYLVALFNKDLLDLRVRLPLPHSVVNVVPASLLAPSPTSLPSNISKQERRYLSFGANTLTKALEWNVRFCLMGYLFDRRGQVRKEFVRERKRKDLVEGLRRRFIFMGVLNAIFAPFIVVYLLIYSFFRYFEEYHKNPSSIGSRQYTPYAQWKFREFNELPHLFERRLDMSYPTAKEYIDQFPKERTALIMRFVAFVAGSFAAVLLVASLIDPDLFLHFEITPHRTVLFYLGIFGSVLAIARGMVPEENLVFDPEASLREVVKWTHYLPGEWKGRLHSQMVHKEFGDLFQMKIAIFFQEVLSVLLTPLILFFSLPPCAGAIIDFFREFSVHVDGVGYVCSFAVFDFTRHGTVKAADQASDSNADDKSSSGPTGTGRKNATRRKGPAYNRANENKMEKSFLHFKATHPDWQPDPSSSIFLDKLVGMGVNRPPHGHEHETGSPLPAGNASSIYGYAGGRSLGLGLGAEDRLRERSRSYDRAWARSSHLLRRGKGGSQEDGDRKVLSKGRPEPGGRLETMRERDGEGEDGEEGYDEAEAMGWNRRLRQESDDDDDGEGDYDDGYDNDKGGRDGFMRDLGMVGLLQQVLNR